MSKVGNWSGYAPHCTYLAAHLSRRPLFPATSCDPPGPMHQLVVACVTFPWDLKWVGHPISSSEVFLNECVISGTNNYQKEKLTVVSHEDCQKSIRLLLCLYRR